MKHAMKIKKVCWKEIG